VVTAGERIDSRQKREAKYFWVVRNTVLSLMGVSIFAYEFLKCPLILQRERYVKINLYFRFVFDMAARYSHY
jgi:hypothetical protein